MRTLRAVSLVAPCLVWIACSQSDGVSLAPTIVFPQDLLGSVTKLTVSVYDTSGGLSCDATTGLVDGLNGQVPIATKDLASSNCSAGAKFCGDIAIDKSGSPRLFTAQGFSGSTLQAAGCTQATPNQDTLQVTIQMLRVLPTPMCNGKTSSVITQCDTGSVGDPVCDPNCQSLEEYFSAGDNSTTGDSAQKARPRFTWPSASADPGRLLGVWGDKSKGASSQEIAMRVLADDMEPVSDSSACIGASSFRVPDTSSQIPCPGQSYAFPQYDPVIATINGTYFVAFEDAQPIAIKIRSFDTNITPQQANAVPVSPTTNVAQTLPSMAANGTSLFIAWENNGTIVGNTIDSTLANLGTQLTLGPGTTVTVAATSTGWVAAWLNGTDVDMVTISSSGTMGTVTKVNSASGASSPGIAAFGTNVAVIWADSGGNILVQRYQNGTAVANDQSTPIQSASLGGNQGNPSIAAGTSFFVATWIDNGSGHVRARFLDGVGGFMFNAVNGQSSDFQASTTDGETRANPIAVVGGAGPYVAIAWEDNTGAPSSYKGIWGRRFPLPQ